MNNNSKKIINTSELLLSTELQPLTRDLAKDMSHTELILHEGLKPLLIEPFDGIKKNNSRKIFGILLIIIIIDFAMDIIL